MALQSSESALLLGTDSGKNLATEMKARLSLCKSKRVKNTLSHCWQQAKSLRSLSPESCFRSSSVSLRLRQAYNHLVHAMVVDGKGNQLQERPLTDAIQCLKTPGEALPLMAALQHDNQSDRQKRARDLKQSCQRLYKHSIKLMGSSCFISSARQVGKSNRSSCRSGVGKGEEAEKGDFTMSAPPFFVPSLSPS